MERQEEKRTTGAAGTRAGSAGKRSKTRRIAGADAPALPNFAPFKTKKNINSNSNAN
ncbi:MULTISPECIES: hypothetical protein [unclassified Acidovorax]|uniref:hypothetical protein n=1 Tax=unclassified Acidovorax TaxID=2684926 RepID=UPI001C48A204|nr:MULTISPECIES: hypothetical protein [unclassified Acidovorax]MBV7429092.1 hypothetical protein [Acidovorax sp. sif0732]MBV7450918.1 hypothetical protein [Acidovorax sp. sif0715]